MSTPTPAPDSRRVKQGLSNDDPPRDPVEAPAFTVVAHLPERWRRGSSGPAHAGAGFWPFDPDQLARAGRGGSCCCCCLHSVGGLIGAAIAPALGGGRKPPEPGGRKPSESGPSAVSLFWRTLLVVVVGGVAVRPREALVSFRNMVLYYLPGLLLGAAVLTALILAGSPRPDKGYQFWRLGKIVLGVAVGTAVGTLIMYPFFIR